MANEKFTLIYVHLYIIIYIRNISYNKNQMKEEK